MKHSIPRLASRMERPEDNLLDTPLGIFLIESKSAMRVADAALVWSAA